MIEEVKASGNQISQAIKVSKITKGTKYFEILSASPWIGALEF